MNEKSSFIYFYHEFAEGCWGNSVNNSYMNIHVHTYIYLHVYEFSYNNNRSQIITQEFRQLIAIDIVTEWYEK